MLFYSNFYFVGADGGAPIIDLRSPTVIDLRTPVFHHGIGGHGGHRGGGQEGRGGRVHVRRGGEGRGGRGGGRLGGRGRAAPNPVFILDEDEAVDDDRPIVLPPVAPVPEIVVMNFLVQPACNHAALPFQIAGPRAQRPGWAYVRCPYYSRCRFFRYLFCANCA